MRGMMRGAAHRPIATSASKRVGPRLGRGCDNRIVQPPDSLGPARHVGQRQKFDHEIGTQREEVVLLLFGQGQRPMQSGRLHSGGSGRLAAATFRLIRRFPEVQELQGVENGRKPRVRPIPVRVQAFQQARHVDVSGSIRRDGAGGELAAHRRQRFGEGIFHGLDSGRVLRAPCSDLPIST